MVTWSKATAFNVAARHDFLTHADALLQSVGLGERDGRAQSRGIVGPRAEQFELKSRHDRLAGIAGAAGSEKRIRIP